MQNPKKVNARSHHDQEKYIPTEEDIQNTLFKKETLVQRWKNSPSKRAFVFFKMPFRATTLDNLVNSTQEIKTNFIASYSIVCPSCSSGIMMRDKDINKKYNGLVEWYCSSSNCNFSVYALPTHNDLKIRIKEPAYEIGQVRLKSMTNEERNGLIDQHMGKSKLFRYTSFFFFIVFFWNLLFQRWVLVSHFFIIFIVTFAFSIKWSYRAWQIKSGNVYLKHAPFIGWFLHAPKWFSLDWYDNDVSTAEKLNEEALEKHYEAMNEVRTKHKETSK